MIFDKTDIEYLEELIASYEKQIVNCEKKMKIYDHEKIGYKDTKALKDKLEKRLLVLQHTKRKIASNV